MNNTQAKQMTIKMPDDVRQLLAAWASANLTSMTAELVRCARERAQREQAERREQAVR